MWHVMSLQRRSMKNCVALCIRSRDLGRVSHGQVREYGAKAEGVRQARKAAQDASGGSEQLEADVQALFDEMQTQRQIVDK